MGKTYEALQRAEQEYAAAMGLDVPKIQRESAAVSAYHRPAARQATMECYEELKTNLLASPSEKSIKTILFSGMNHGDGTSTTVVNFALTLTRDPVNKVLLMDANLRTPSLHGAFHLEQSRGLSDLPNNRQTAEFLVKKVENRNLYVITCGGHPHVGPVGLFESSVFCEFLKAMRVRFDYVIIDGPPIPRFSETRVLCAKVDGVVMVLSAGKTREHVAKRAKQEIEEAGGRVLGMVLNRRKLYIPEWLYRRL